MKFSLRAVLLILSLSTFGSLAVAADEAPSATPETYSTDIVHLGYYAHPRVLYLVPELEYIPRNRSRADVGGGVGNISHAYSEQASLEAVYGLPIDGLRFGVSESWLVKHFNDTTNSANGKISQIDSSGFSDPTFELQYRYFRNPDETFASDINFFVSPSFVSRTVGTNTDSGNNGRGYGLAGISSNVYWVVPKNDVSLTASFTKDFSGLGNNPTNANASYTRGSTSTFTFETTDRYHFTNDFYAEAFAIFNFAYSYDQTNQAPTPVTRNFRIPFHVNPSVALGYRIRKNFVLDGIFTYSNYTTENTPDNGAATTETLGTENTLELRARIEI